MTLQEMYNRARSMTGFEAFVTGKAPYSDPPIRRIGDFIQTVDPKDVPLLQLLMEKNDERGTNRLWPRIDQGSE